MVTSIVLTGRYNIGISQSGKIKTPDGVLVDIKDIPFVRYRFEEYTDEDLEFISANMKKFPCVHLVEINVNDNGLWALEQINMAEMNVAKMLYVPVGDNEVANGFTDEVLDCLENMCDFEFDKVNLKDISTTLYPAAVDKLKAEVASITGFTVNEIGVCGGPCCFINGNACLTAVKARELLAAYSNDEDTCVVPSANHEGNLDKLDNAVDCVNKCGCIRYHVFTFDMEAPASKVAGKKTSVKVENTDAEVEVTVKEKKPKVKKPKGYVLTDW